MAASLRAEAVGGRHFRENVLDYSLAKLFETEVGRPLEGYRNIQIHICPGPVANWARILALLLLVMVCLLGARVHGLLDEDGRQRFACDRFGVCAPLQDDQVDGRAVDRSARHAALPDLLHSCVRQGLHADDSGGPSCGRGR